MKNAMEQITRPKSLTEIAHENIRRAITKGHLRLGQPISESGLASSLGTSKTPVREALAQLKIEGLVNIFPQKGTFVFTMSEKEVLDICELRYTLESTALKLAMERNKQQFLSDLRSVVGRMKKAHNKGEDDQYLDLDTEYHNLFFRHCGNQYLEDAFKLIGARVEAVRTHLAALPQHMEKSCDEHIKMTKSLNQGEFEDTLKILNEHITRTKESAAVHIPNYKF